MSNRDYQSDEKDMTGLDATWWVSLIFALCILGTLMFSVATFEEIGQGGALRCDHGTGTRPAPAAKPTGVGG